VVAAEIRKLAEQAAVAAKQITEILERIHREDIALAQAMEEEARETDRKGELVGILGGDLRLV
jgi:methyl-accepting chemotaxis protein